MPEELTSIAPAEDAARFRTFHWRFDLAADPAGTERLRQSLACWERKARTVHGWLGATVPVAGDWTPLSPAKF